MPKSKLEQKLKPAPQAVVTDNFESPAKDDNQNQITTLQQQIAELESRIATLKNEIAECDRTIREGEEAIALLESPPKWGIPSGKFDLFDQMQEALVNARDEQERTRKLEAMRVSLQRGRLMLQDKQVQLLSVESELQDLCEELDWQQNYLPYLNEYQNAYTLPKEQQYKINQISGYVCDLSRRLGEMKQIAQDSELIKKWEKKNYMSPSFKHAYEEIQAGVARREEELEKFKTVDQKHFRQFIRARRDIEASLQALIVQQENYFAKLDKFIADLKRHGQALLGIESLTQYNLPVVSVNDKNQITITTKKL
ncbi:MAG: hypothetical protein KME28_13055 [Pelatocladus maniniholoensis HA4357-MV3]|uniref:Uncharacterized protein n=1 Tax=Pelatocladus maniniholoensis HA4357-MV3 TaxID=1117104 RepID=A0A9E3H7Z1_9NOST|nr:hypothetical protein [Pelatocladus maniniholoensis HA4357-MV3]BAZ65569.1 hypothetical protein NIES4106_03080 [Fischerella sp. NIES-4106]